MSNALSTIRQSIGRLMGMASPALITGTPTGTLSTGAFAASGLALYEDDFFNGWNIRFYSGTHKDITREVTDFATTTGLVTFLPVVTGAIDATDLFELWRDFTPEEVIAAINLAISMVEDEALAEKVDESLVMNDLLADGLFEIWTSSSILTNWTKGGTGTLAQETTIKREGTYSAKVGNTVGNACYLTQSVGNPALYAGRTASLYARVFCATASRVRLELTDGVTVWYSDYHSGNGWLEGESETYLKIESKAISSLATELTAQFRIETGAAIFAYVDKMFLVCGDSIYEYSLPSGFHSIGAIFQEQGTVGRFSGWSNMIDPKQGWRLLSTGTTRKIWFDPSIVTMVNGRKFRIVGQAKAGQLTLDADTTEIPLVYLTQQAKALLHQSRISGPSGVSEMHETQFKMAQVMAERARVALQVPTRGKKVL